MVNRSVLYIFLSITLFHMLSLMGQENDVNIKYIFDSIKKDKSIYDENNYIEFNRAISKYKEFVSKYPESEYAEKARVQIKIYQTYEFSKRGRTNDLILLQKGLKAFIAEYPDYYNIDKVKNKLESTHLNILWSCDRKVNNEYGNISYYIDYSKTYAESKHADDALLRVVELALSNNNEGKAIEILNNIIEDFSNRDMNRYDLTGAMEIGIWTDELNLFVEENHIRTQDWGFLLLSKYYFDSNEYIKSKKHAIQLLSITNKPLIPKNANGGYVYTQEIRGDLLKLLYDIAIKTNDNELKITILEIALKEYGVIEEDFTHKYERLIEREVFRRLTIDPKTADTYCPYPRYMNIYNNRKTEDVGSVSSPNRTLKTKNATSVNSETPSTSKAIYVALSAIVLLIGIGLIVFRLRKCKKANTEVNE